MSRLGKLPVSIPGGVEVKVNGKIVSVKGPKGSLELELKHMVKAEVEADQVIVSTTTDDAAAGKFYGLYRTLIWNMIEGVTAGFEKKLKMIGVGYRSALQGNLLDIQVGLSHPLKLSVPEGIKVEIEKNTLITISGSDRQKVGQFAADIRAVRPPEPYQGKGIRYLDERVRRKAGKTAASR